MTRDEGVFLITAADDGSRVAYFIAQNTRHSIGQGDLQLEQQLNPLWPVRSVSRDEVLAFPEAAPIGTAKMGLIKVEVEASDEPAVEPVAEMASPVAEAPSIVAQAPSPVAQATSPVADEPQSAVVEDMPSPEAEAPVADEALAPVVAAHQPVVSSTPAASPTPTAQAMPHVAEIPLDAPAAGQAAPTPSLDLRPSAAQNPNDLQPATTEPTLYVLKAGNNLTHLSVRFGTTVQAIMAANSIANPSRVFVGQPLVIPAAAPKPDVVESPTAPAPIADAVQEPTADAPTDAEVAKTYTVKSGDSAITIAKQLGVNVDELLATNAVFHRNRVYVGQVLRIPEARS